MSRRREEEEEEASDASDASDAPADEDEEQGEDSEQEEAAWRAEAERAQQRKRQKGLLGKSRLTHQDRRHVRHKERELLQSMRENAQDLARLSSEAFRETTRELQQMYEDVCYPREANLDASNLDELNVAVAKQSQALGSSDLTKFDTADLIRATREACTSDSQGGNFDWNTLGTAAGACFRAVPEIGFLFGMMDTEVVHKQRKRTRRAVEDEETKESRPSEYTNKKDRKDAQARRLEVLQNTIERENKRAFFDMVINPKSFTQTVENIFDTSFLVRNGSAGIDVDESGLPFVENYEGRNEADAMRIQAQSIISITPAQWQQISQVWGKEEPLIGHRS